MMGELFGALGLAWPRLLLYPGGLFALGASWLLARWLAWCGRRPWAAGAPVGAAGMLELVPPLAALTLLPLAPARGFPYGLDLVVAVGLLEWPRLRLLVRAGPGRAALVRSYGPLVVGAALMAAGAGGLGLSGLLSWPGGWLERLLLAGGACIWLLALPGLLAAGPWGVAGRLRALGLLLVGALPWVGGLAALLAGRVPAELAAWLVVPLAGAGVAAALGAAVRVLR